MQNSYKSDETLQQAIHKLQTAVFKKLSNQFALYVAPQVGYHPNDEVCLDAFQQIEEWLSSEIDCLLLHGDSGAGKTLFGQWLIYHFWKSYHFGDRLCIFIPLNGQDSKYSQQLERCLQNYYGLTKEEIALIKSQPLLLFFDAYDEMLNKANLFQTNSLHNLNTKVIISCYTLVLSTLKDYSSYFVPLDAKGQAQPKKLAERVIKPFNAYQIDAYLQQYVSLYSKSAENYPAAPLQSNWSNWRTYRNYLDRMPALRGLAISPFALSMLAAELPNILKKYQDKPEVEQLAWTRLELVEQHMESWFKRRAQKLKDAKRIAEDCPIEEAFQAFSQDLAETMLELNVTHFIYKPEEEIQNNASFFSSASSAAKNSPWKRFFDDSILINIGNYKISHELIRFGCPLKQTSEYEYTFTHKSLRDYFAARQLFEGAMSRTSIALGCELNDSLLNTEHEVINFLVDKVNKDPFLQEQLFEVVEESKHEPLIANAAANAMTILNHANISLANRNLRGIQVQGANLAGAILERADLSESDLRNVNFQGAWLEGAKLNNACLDNIIVGELPQLKLESFTEKFAISPDDNWLVMDVGTGRMVHLYDIKQNSMAAQFKVRKHDVFGEPIYKSCFAFSPDSSYLAFGGQDKTTTLWSIKEAKVVNKFIGHIEHISSIDFSPDGKRMVTTGKNMMLWDLLSGECLFDTRSVSNIGSYRIASGDTFTLANFTADGEYMLVKYDNKQRFGLWRASTNDCRLINTFGSSQDTVTAIALNLESKLGIVAYRSKSMVIWDFASGSKLYTWTNLPHKIKSMAISPDGRFMLAATKHKLQCWDLSNKQLINTMIMNSLQQVVFLNNGKRFCTGVSSTLKFWESDTMLCPVLRPLQQDKITSACFSADKKYVLTGSGNGNLCLRDGTSGKTLKIFSGHTKAVLSLAYSERGNYFASGGADNILLLWDGSSGKLLGKLADIKAAINCIAFSQDEKLIAAGCEDGTIWVGSVVSLKCLEVISMYEKCVNSLAFSPDSKTLIWGGDDWALNVWDIESASCTARLEGYKDYIDKVFFSIDGATIYSENRNGTIYVWDAYSLECQEIVNMHVNTISLNQDLTVLLSIKDNSLWLEDIKTKQWSLRIPEFDMVKQFRNKIIWCDNQFIILYAGGITCWHLAFDKSQPKLSLQWRINQTNIRLLDAEIHQTTGLTDIAYKVFCQSGAKGRRADKKLSVDVINSRQQAIAFNPRKPPLSIFNKKAIDESFAVVNLVCKKNNEHAFLLLEMIDNGYYKIRRIDFFIDSNYKQSALLFGHIKRGKGLIQSHPKGLLDLGIDDAFEKRNFLANHNYQPHRTRITLHTKALDDIKRLIQQKYRYKSWRITAKQTTQLLENIAEDQQKGISYLETGNSKLYAGLDQGMEKHNCLSFCEKHLKGIGIDLSQQQSWLDTFAMITSRHLAAPDIDGFEDTSYRIKCLTM